MRGSGKAAVWRERLRRYERAEVTVAEFCQREGVSVASFYQWRKRLAEALAGRRQMRSTPRQRPEAAPAFQQVMLAGGGVVAIELPSGVRMELPAHQVQLVRAVVAELVQIESGRSMGEA